MKEILIEFGMLLFSMILLSIVVAVLVIIVSKLMLLVKFKIYIYKNRYSLGYKVKQVLKDTFGNNVDMLIRWYYTEDDKYE